MTPDLLLIVVGVFISVAIAGGSLSWLVLARQAPERQRLRNLTDEGSSLLTLAQPRLSETPQGRPRVATFVPKSPKEMKRLGRRLAMAGYFGQRPIVVYVLAELILPVVFGVTPLLFLPWRIAWMVALFAAIVGYLLPGLILNRQIGVRQKVIQNGLPDALDLFIVCLEAGCALDQAILKASEELDLAYPALARELQVISIEMRAGKPRLEAFKNFAARTGVEDVRALVAMLVQTDRFGTSVAQALRTHAETARTKRRQRAEEAAAKIGVKLVFPLVFCLFPSFYVITLGPAVVRFVRIFLGQLVPG